MRSPCVTLVLSLLVPVAALAAEVGRVEVIAGKAVRLSADGKKSALRVGAKVELGDTLRVERGNLKLRLTDQSVLMLGEKAQLRLDAAQFQGLERKRFGATLLAGSVWARVKKALAGSERNFEVATERAVAGVRGTEFRVDVRFLDGQSFTRVSVWEGSVYVRGQIQAPRMSVAMDTGALRAPDSVPSPARSAAAPQRKAAREEAPSVSAGMPAAPPPPPPPMAAPAAEAASAGASKVERVLELSTGDAVLVGPNDDWEPDRAREGLDPLAKFAAAQKK
ncbi:MAG: FecR family protein [Myxococcota bacterium]|nr:FecR family protein [Myxococcota bacterium]